MGEAELRLVAHIAELEAENARLRADQARLDDMRARWNELVSERDEARAQLAAIRAVLAKVDSKVLGPQDSPLAMAHRRADRMERIIRKALEALNDGE